MKLYSENDNYKLYQGNMLDMLEVIEPNTIDSVVTDPPYGLTSITKRFGKENSAECQYGKDGSFARLSRGFMGKEWDGSGIEYNIDTWKKCYEVLKPGGYLLAFGGSRTFHRIACAIEDAGFEIRDTIMWLYGSGFPKSMDISKSLDKRNGRNYNEDFRKYINEKRIEKNISLKEINELFGLSTDGGGVASYIFSERQQNGLPTKEQYLILKDKLELDDRFDNLIFIEEAEREVIGKQQYTNSKKFFEYDGERVHLDITAPATDLAKQWQGWGTALKPSFEPIIVARKPFKGSLVDNVIQYGVGGINIDECRVETNGEKIDIHHTKGASMFRDGEYQELDRFNSTQGRFPANTILTYDETDFDEVCGGFPNNKGFYRPNCKNKSYNQSSNIQLGGGNVSSQYNDSGSASRYFYCAKASAKDRNEGLDAEIEEYVLKEDTPKEIEQLILNSLTS